VWCEALHLAMDRCALRMAGLPPAPQLEALADAVAAVDWWWPQRGAAVLTDRPTVIALDDQGRPHADGGPALAWADGHTLHAVHGVLVPASVVEAPGTITFDQVNDEENVEVRRVLLERYGPRRYLRDAGGERSHTDQFGTLWRCYLSGEGGEEDEELVLVEVTNATPEPNGSHKTYWLRVPPWVWTAREAVAWTFGLDEDAYRPEAQT
jgi:hypothetical protein